MEWIFPSNVKCVHCKLPIPKNNSYSLCKECFEQIRFREEDQLCTFYEGVMVQLIHAFKYQDKTYLADIFAQIMHQKIKHTGTTTDGLMSIPSSQKRFRQRGYNPCELLCDALSKRTGFPHLKLLDRIRDTAPMSGLNPVQRLMEISGVFRLKENLPDLTGKKILLIDDILTTGATISEAVALIRAIDSGIRMDFMVLSSNRMLKDGGSLWI